MILIAESGSTKTNWRILDKDGEISQAKSSGMNPYYQSDEELRAAIREGMDSTSRADVEAVYHYGAGCSSDNNKMRLADAYREIFGDVYVEINHDLIAAARALCGNDSGIACILGTGANSCLYDGQEIVENVPSVGYVLGDEGSGSNLGKTLLTAYIRDEIPEHIREKMDNRFQLSKDIILENVYRDEMPITYLAGFSKFIFRNIKEPYLHQMVYHAFDQFFKRNILKYTGCHEQPVHFTGSVAFYYGNILRNVAASHHINLQRIVENPIAGLALYHQEKQL